MNGRSKKRLLRINGRSGKHLRWHFYRLTQARFCAHDHLVLKHGFIAHGPFLDPDCLAVAPIKVDDRPGACAHRVYVGLAGAVQCVGRRRRSSIAFTELGARHIHDNARRTSECNQYARSRFIMRSLNCFKHFVREPKQAT
eukprot:3830176-Prymnesium_polylepis.1